MFWVKNLFTILIILLLLDIMLLFVNFCKFLNFLDYLQMTYQNILRLFPHLKEFIIVEFKIHESLVLFKQLSNISGIFDDVLIKSLTEQPSNFLKIQDNNIIIFDENLWLFKILCHCSPSWKIYVIKNTVFVSFLKFLKSYCW